MKNWKQAFKLAMFELKASAISFLFLFVFLLVMLAYFSTSFPDYSERGYVGYDLFFILVFLFAGSSSKVKHFQLQKLNGDLWVVPIVVMQNQLPIPQNTIIKSRFIIHFFLSFPFQLLLLIALYLWSAELRMIMSFHAFISFSIFWISFGIYTGYAIPASEAGDKINYKTVITAVIFLAIIFISILTGFNVLFDCGFVYWTMMLANKWPYLTILVSILLAICGLIFWQNYMKKTMNKLDYF